MKTTLTTCNRCNAESRGVGNPAIERAVYGEYESESVDLCKRCMRAALDFFLRDYSGDPEIEYRRGRYIHRTEALRKWIADSRKPSGDKLPAAPPAEPGGGE